MCKGAFLGPTVGGHDPRGFNRYTFPVAKIESTDVPAYNAVSGQTLLPLP